MNLKARMSLAITALVVALVGAGAAIQAHFVQATLKQTVADQQFSLVERVADEIDNRIRLNQAALARIAAGITPELIADDARLQAYLEGKLGMLALFDDLIVVSPDLRVLADVPPFPGRRGVSVARLEHLQRAFKTRQPQVSQPFLGVATQRPTLTLTVPILAADGTVTGVLNGQQNLLSLNFLGSLSERKVGKSGHFVLTTPERLTIVSRFKERILKPNAPPGANPVYDRALAGWEGSEEGTTSYGTTMLMSFKTLKSTGWVLGALLPAEEADAPIDASRRLALGLLAGASLLVALIVWLSMRRVLAPLTALRRNIRALRERPELVRTFNASRDEIGEVAADFYRLFDELAQARRESAARAEQLQSILDASPLTVCVVAERRLLSANRAFERMFGYRFDEVAGESVERFYLSPQAFADFGRRLYPALAGGEVYQTEIQFRDRGGRIFWAVFYARLLDLQHPDKGAVVMIEDCNARKAAEAALRASEEHCRLSAKVIEGSAEGIFITDRDNRIVSVNPAFCRITGYTPADVLGRNPHLFKSDRYDAAFYGAMWEAIRTRGAWAGEIWNRGKDGRVFPEWLTINVVRDERGEVSNYVGIFTDISERKASEAHIRHLAEHDALTGLPNRALLNDRLAQAIVKAQRERRKIALIFLDLDRFKNINDSLGHHIGDLLLQAVAERIQLATRASDTVSRPGGDEFILLLPEIEHTDDAARVAEKLLESLARPYPIEGHELVVTASIGISVYPDDGEDMQTLVRNADTAMYHSKESGRNAYHYFAPEMNTRVFERMSLEHSLRHALEREEFLLHYQPQIDIRSGRVVGMEALVRWRHPVDGLVPPGKFIPVAEDSGLILGLGAWVLREACRQNRAWQAAGLPAVPVAVNISALQFRQKDFAATIDLALASTGLAPACLELELTESVMMSAAERNIELLDALRQVGVKVSIDDFGTGYSSLSYLKRLPLDKLKIDQAFVRDIATDADDAAIIGAIIGLAQNLQLKVIAEGVETAEQLAFLSQGSCDEAQGYFFCRPVPAAEFEAYWRERLVAAEHLPLGGAHERP